MTPRLKTWLRRITRCALAGISLLVLVIAGSNAHVILSTSDRVFDRVEDVPSGGVGLVLGTLPEADFFYHRLDAAATLWKAGKVKGFVISGDGGPLAQNQMALMREGLVARGIPASLIQEDPAGYRTLDSLARFKSFAGDAPVVVVSQRFHNYRSLVLADHFGVKGCAFEARHSDHAYDLWKSEFREMLARVKVLLDLYVLGTEPRELVPKR